MPETIDRQLIRSILSKDPVWSVYALGDLSPRRLAHATWYVTATQDALILLYREFGRPVLFALGEAESLLSEIAPEPEMYLQIKPGLVSAIERLGYRLNWAKHMIRMSLHCYAAVETAGAEPLSNAAELRALYSDGEQKNESPDFFFDSMLDDGTFFGIRREGQLIAAAGTHLTAAEEGVAAIGNVYVHRDWRRRGFGRTVTAAVTEELLKRGIRTIALNVSHTNESAIRTYERLGFIPHCEFREGFCEGSPEYPMVP